MLVRAEGKPASLSSQSPSGLPGGLGGSCRPFPELQLPTSSDLEIETIAPPLAHRQRATAHSPSCALKTHPRRHIIAGGYLSEQTVVGSLALRSTPQLTHHPTPGHLTRLGPASLSTACTSMIVSL